MDQNITRIERRSYKAAENILQDFDYSNLPHLLPEKCHSCKNCAKCKYQNEDKSHEDFLQEELMRENLRYDKENKRFVANDI